MVEDIKIESTYLGRGGVEAQLHQVSWNFRDILKWSSASITLPTPQ